MPTKLRYLSPLRYPGGKSQLAPFFSRIISAQENRPTRYAEPFAGGAGAALKLLVSGDVEHIHINDINPGIAAFWRSIFTNSAEFIKLIEQTPIDVEHWYQAREVYLSPALYNDLELGFATFFLNRTNRSGILLARPIGGLEQTGQWKIDARFNRENLSSRVRYLSTFSERVTVTEGDALDFLREIEQFGEDVFTYIDPPYLTQGDYLYLDAFDSDAHLALSNLLKDMETPWVLTYDADKRINESLYIGERCAQFGISHTAQVQHVGSEYVVFGSSLVLPDMQITARSQAVWI